MHTGYMNPINPLFSAGLNESKWVGKGISIPTMYKGYPSRINGSNDANNV